MELQWVKEVGFPIAIAIFVLVRLNGKFDRLTTAVYGLISAIDIVNERLGYRNASSAAFDRHRLIEEAKAREEKDR